MSKLTHDDYTLIGQIADRAVKELGYEYKHVAFMDVCICHEHICELRLEELLNADHTNFAHDMLGINANLDRAFYQLYNEFTPRFAK